MSSEKRLGRVRETPRISVSKLGEYLDVRNAHRREQIIHDQKYLMGPKVWRYRDAHSAIRAALVGADAEVDKRLSDWAAIIGGRITTTPYSRDTQRCCVEAITAFRALVPSLPLDGVERTLPGRTEFAVPIEGVDVSLHPVALLERVDRRGRVERGAIQVVFRKEVALETHGGQAAAEMLRRGLSAAGFAAVSPNLCLVVDVFGEQHFAAPARYKRLMGDIEAACREIAVRWPAVAA